MTMIDDHYCCQGHLSSAQLCTSGSNCFVWQQTVDVRSGPAGTHVYGLLPADVARRVHGVRPDAIAFAPKGVLAG